MCKENCNAGLKSYIIVVCMCVFVCVCIYIYTLIFTINLVSLITYFVIDISFNSLLSEHEKQLSLNSSQKNRDITQNDTNHLESTQEDLFTIKGERAAVFINNLNFHN